MTMICLKTSSMFGFVTIEPFTDSLKCIVHFRQSQENVPCCWFHQGSLSRYPFLKISLANNATGQAPKIWLAHCTNKEMYILVVNLTEQFSKKEKEIENKTIFLSFVTKKGFGYESVHISSTAGAKCGAPI